MSLRILRKFSKPNIFHLVQLEDREVENLFFSILGDFSLLEYILGHYFDLSFFISIFLCLKLKQWLESRFFKCMPQYIRTAFKLILMRHVIDYQINHPTNLSFLKLLVFITHQDVKTEYFPCNFHFFVLKMTNKA